MAILYLTLYNKFSYNYMKTVCFVCVFIKKDVSQTEFNLKKEKKCHLVDIKIKY